MSFWENVENVREFKDISRKELAYQANFSLNSISTGIARNSIPAADVACRIAHVLGVSVEFLVNGNNAGVEQSDRASKADAENTERQITAKILDKKGNLIKYMDKYAGVIEDFSQIPPDMQKTVAELVHKIANGVKNVENS